MIDKVIKLDQFEGPLSLLLQLIEKEELDISEISLAKVTDQYIQILKQQDNLHPDELANFLVVAAKLLYLKSKLLLPYYQSEEDEGTELEKQLRLYRRFASAAKHLRKAWESGKVLVSRERPLQRAEIRFVPPQGLGMADLRILMGDILAEIEPVVRLQTKKLDQSVTISEKLELIKQLVANKLKVKFDSLLKESKNKTEQIVSFLALLELVKRQEVKVVQSSLFTEIIIEINK